MVTKIQKWGNSQGLRLPKSILDEMRITEGDSVYVSIRQGKIIIMPVKKARSKYKLKNLVSEIPSEYGSKEEDWGSVVGKEAW